MDMAINLHEQSNFECIKENQNELGWRDAQWLEVVTALAEDMG